MVKKLSIICDVRSANYKRETQEGESGVIPLHQQGILPPGLPGTLSAKKSIGQKYHMANRNHSL